MRAGAIRLVMAGLLASTGLASPAHAVSPLKRPVPDNNGVDVISGIPIISSGHLMIGQPSQGGLDFYRVWQGGGWYHDLQGTVIASGTTYTVSVGPSVETFTLSGGIYQSVDGIGSTLTKAMNGVWTYTLSDGTVVTFENPGTLGDAGVKGMLASIVKPSGLSMTFTNVYQGFCEKIGSSCDTPVTYSVRVQSVTTNTGYHMKFQYLYNYTGSGAADLGFQDGWLQLGSVTAINSSVDYCNPAAPSCTSLTQSWPSVQISKRTGVVGSFTDTWLDALNNATTSQVTSSQLSSVQSPANPGVDFTLGYDGSGRVATFTRGGGTWTYTYSDVGTQRTTTVTQPGGGSKVYVSDTSNRKLISVTDELGRATSYAYDSFVRPTQVTQPEGNYTQLTYDARGNVTQRRSVAKPGSGLADIVSSASYDSTCSNPKTCNEPNSTTDAKGNTTDYTYDPNHGGMLTATQPAPTTGAVRPQVRYTYATKQAYYKTSSTGSPTASGQPIYLLTAVSACQTLASCTGAADEVKATVDYGPQVTGTANNLLPVSISKGSGDGALTATTTNAYDIFGNVTSVDGPLAGTADTTGFRYDANRQLTMRVSPDPDGAGPLHNRAQQITYNGDGNVTRIEAGTTTSLTGPFTRVATGERVEFSYDSLGRKITQSAVSGTIASPVTQTLTQYSYDTKGRLNCTAVRMNAAAFGSLPADACTLGTAGSFGPDRITKSIFDNADEVTQLQQAVGTTDAANERTLTYSNNGKLQTLTDAENNKTTYVYDGFDRLSQTQYPSATKGSGTSNPADSEQLGYDANGNVTSKLRRDGGTITYSYDNLDRLTLKHLPGSGGTTYADYDQSYAYDNLGRITSAGDVGLTGINFTYDALSRQTSQFDWNGTTSSAYDLAGRRTRLTYPDGFYADTDYLVTGEVSKIRENGATTGVGVLATYGYDDLGNRTSVTFGNGEADSYAYDPASRLSQLTLDLSGTANDLTKTFAYNPASQIVSETKSNDAYAYNPADEATASTSNGLNQVTQQGSTAIGYSTRGNVSSKGAQSYTYTSEDRLSAAVAVSYMIRDAFGRVIDYNDYAHGGTDYVVKSDGLDAIGDGPDRFVFADTDQPIAWYDSAGTRHFLHADERGSIVAVTDSSGGLTGINRYDDYGQAQGTLTGKFGYAGQRAMAFTGLYDDRNRVYDPGQGRFMQIDPIGYADSPNVYAYVLNDPVNLVDPSGLWHTSPPDPDPCADHPEECITVTGSLLGFQLVPLSLTSAFGGFLSSFSFADGGNSSPQKKQSDRLLCSGRAYVLAGNPANVGQPGFPGVTVTNGSAAVIPRQFTGAVTGGPIMRAIGADTYGIVFGPGGESETFRHITQPIGFRRLGPAVNVQNMIMARDPGALVLEIVGGTNTWKDAWTILSMPNVGQGCPAGTHK